MEKEILLFNRAIYKKENYEQALEMTKELVEKAKEEKGAIIYDMYEDINIENSICILEKWETMEDLENHWKSEHFNKIVPALGDLTIDQSEVYKFSKLD